MKLVKYSALSCALMIVSMGFSSRAQASTTQAVPAKAELVKSLSAKNAKPGDAVAAKLTSEVKLPDGTTLPRNTVITGKIDTVNAASSGDEMSKMTLTFDNARVKGGKTVAVKAMIVRISSPFNPSDTNDKASMSVGPMSIPDDQAVKFSPGAKGSFGLESDMQSSTSGTVTRAGNDVELARGTDMLLAVSVAGQ